MGRPEGLRDSESSRDPDSEGPSRQVRGDPSATRQPQWSEQDRCHRRGDNPRNCYAAKSVVPPRASGSEQSTRWCQGSCEVPSIRWLRSRLSDGGDGSVRTVAECLMSSLFRNGTLQPRRKWTWHPLQKHHTFRWPPCNPHLADRRQRLCGRRQCPYRVWHRPAP